MKPFEDNFHEKCIFFFFQESANSEIAQYRIPSDKHMLRLSKLTITQAFNH